MSMINKFGPCNVEPIKFHEKLFSFFRLFKLTKFEKDIIEAFMSVLTGSVIDVIKVQLASFNRMVRLLNMDDRGMVYFAHSRDRLKKIDELPKVNLSKGVYVVGSMVANCDDGNEIICKIELYDGVLYKIKFKSNIGACYPRADYVFVRIKAKIDISNPDDVPVNLVANEKAG